MPLFDDYEEHMQYMAARERLQEFPGRIPPRKKRNQSNANNDTRKAKVSAMNSFHFLHVDEFCSHAIGAFCSEKKNKQTNNKRTERT